MSEWQGEGRALFASAREGFAATEDDRARVARALSAQLGAAVLTAKGTSAAASTAPSVWASSILGMKGIFAVVVVATVGAGAALWREHRALPLPVPGAQPTATSAVVAASEPNQSVPPLPNPRDRGTSPANADEVVPSSSPPPRPPSAAPARATVADEARLLRDADSALRSGNAGEALALLDAHARNFPRGVLGQEREAERVFALCAAGRIEEARATATRLSTRQPDSPLAKSLRASCVGAKGSP